MKSTLFHFCLLAGICISGAFAQQGKQAPPPNSTTPEMQSLANALAGTWSITENFEPDEWTANGGMGYGEEVWRRGPGGFTLIEEVHDHTPNWESFGLALTWWDKSKGFQGMWCVDSNPKGCDQPGSGFGPKWDGKQLVIENEFERHGKRFIWHEVYSDITPGVSFAQTADIGEKGGQLKRWLTIHATRVAREAADNSPTAWPNTGQTVAPLQQAAPSAGASGANNGSEAELVLLTNAWIDAINTKNRSKLDELMAPDFVLHAWDGSWQVERSRWLENLLQHIDIQAYSHSAIVPRIYGDVAAVTSKWYWRGMRGTAEKKPFEEHGYVVDVWERKRGRWQVISRTSVVLPGQGEPTTVDSSRRSLDKAAAEEAFTQQIDPALQGFWTLNVEKSDFSGRPKPKMGQVNWGEHGWTFALVTADGRLYADGVATDRGCTLIGVFPNYSCEVEVVTPRHVRFTLRQGAAVRRIGDIELLQDGTAQTTHRVTPPEGAPYVEKTIWERQVRK